MNTRVASWAVRDLRGLAVALLQLTKPGVTRMVVATMLCGAVIAPGPLSTARLVLGLLGTTLVVASANALNMVLEVDVDARMARTRARPLPSGRLAVEDAAWFGVALGVVGLGLLLAFVNPITAALGALALLSYVLVYTPMKRVSPFAVWVGAVPGAVPPLMGWTSMTGEVTAGALSIFALLLVWQVPHFHAIAIFRQSEYQGAGLQVLPAARGLEYTKLAIVGTVMLGLVVSAFPAFLGVGGRWYVAAATLLGAVYLGWALAGLRPQAGARWARSLFFASMPYLLLLFAALVIDAV